MGYSLILLVKGCLLAFGLMRMMQALMRRAVDPAKVAVSHPVIEVGCAKSQQSLVLKHPPQIPNISQAGVTNDSAMLMILLVPNVK